ncbi:MAG: monovalent cation/H+ antiporter subunit D family protein [Akkermansiaceae bacterium]|nr:monovalent cation/H+ antiporter subunit D family protein [Akkermansiaceae bacterium]
MSDQLPIIIVLAPLFGALIIGLVGSRDHRVCVPVVLVALLTSLIAVIGTLTQVLETGPVDYFVGGWEPGKMAPGVHGPVEIAKGFGIQLRVDTLNGFLLLAIAIVSIFVSIFSIRRANQEAASKTPQFYTLYLLLCVGLFGMTITGDAFNLFVLVEVTSLTSYALIAMGRNRRGTMAAFNYILMGTVGASFYLLGVGYLYLKTGSLNMEHIQEVLSANDFEIGRSKPVMVAFVLIMVGIWIKMAFFPLYGWLPNAYSYCPSTSSCLLAPLMTKISVYIMIRVMLSVFGWEWIFIEYAGWSDAVVILAVIAILAGSTLALAQRELKKMLCYLIVAEVGYMVGGAWLGDPERWGMSGAVYHILADAFMTLCLFLCAGIFAKKANATRIEDLSGMFKKMPLTMTGFVVGALAMIGIPPTCGFFSKFYLIRGGIEGGHWEFVIALIISSLVNVVLFFRIFEIAFFGAKPAEGHDHAHHHDEDDHSSNNQDPIDEPTLLEREAPLRSLIPLFGTAAIIILLGVYNGQIVEWIRLTIKP